jgi:hypothetical protein
MARRFFAGMVTVISILASVRGLADLGPPPGYVEKCTVKAQTKRGEECRVCGAYFASREECLQLGRQGYNQRCRSHGASVWSEVWCRLAPKATDGGRPGGSR